MSQEMEEEVVERGFLSERAEEFRVLENQKFRIQESEHSCWCKCHRPFEQMALSSDVKRINRTRVSRSEMKLILLTLSPWRGCHQPERVG